MNIPAPEIVASPPVQISAKTEPMDNKDRARSPLELANEQGRRIQELVDQVERLPDPAARGLAQDCIQSILAFYGMGLERILHLLGEAAGKNRIGYEALTTDAVVRGLLLIHGLHPVSLQARLKEALDKVRPYMQSHGGNVELISLEDGHARLKLVGACDSCASSAVTMELALRQAIDEACPDLASFEVEGGGAMPTPGGSPRGVSEQVSLEGTHDLQNGSFLALKAGSVPLILCKTAGQLYAYRDQCPACNLPLHLGEMEESTFKCNLGHTFDIRQAGRSLQRADLHLDPFPLTIENGSTRVSVR